MPVKKKTVTERLPCQLTDEERLAFADELSEANQRVDEAKHNKKSMMKQMQAELDQHEARRDRLSGIVASKTEYRDTDVEVQMNFEKGIVIKIRKDTGEEILNRPMTQKERQLSLDGELALDE